MFDMGKNWSAGLSGIPGTPNFDVRLFNSRNKKIGKKHSAEWNKNISVGQKGKKCRPRTGEEKRKISEQFLVLWQTKEFRNKMANRHKHYSTKNKKSLLYVPNLSSLFILKKVFPSRSESAKIRWSKPVYREKQLKNLQIVHASLKYRIFTPEWRNKISLSMIGNRNQEIQHTQETKNKISESHKNIWLNPDRRSGLFIQEGRYETKKHYLLKKAVYSHLIECGYKTQIEKPICIDGKRFIIDVYADDGSEKVIVEIGNCSPIKLGLLRNHYKQVYHIKFKDNWRNMLSNIKMVVN